MEERVICGLRFIDAEPSVYDFNFNNFHIIDGGEFLEPTVFTQNLVDQAGHLSMTEFLNYPYFYNRMDGDGDGLFQLAGSYHTRLNQLVNFLWFSRDNSVNVGDLFAFVPETDRLFRNTKLSFYSNSVGNTESVPITGSDFQKAADAFVQFKRLESSSVEFILPKNEPNGRPIVTDSSYHFADYNKNTRIERAFSFLTMARTHSFLPLKISLYMSLLECLFTTDKQEVTHKVCERVALYLKGSYDDQITNYNTIKQAYSIRSGFFHGQTIDNKQDSRSKLADHSAKVDNLLRQIFNKVLFEDFEIFNGSDETRIKYFQKMIFR